MISNAVFDGRVVIKSVTTSIELSLLPSSTIIISQFTIIVSLFFSVDKVSNTGARSVCVNAKTSGKNACKASASLYAGIIIDK